MLLVYISKSNNLTTTTKSYMKNRVKWDSYNFRLTTDGEGFTAFAYDMFLEGNLVDTLIFYDCSHKKAEERFFRHRFNKMEYVGNENTPVQITNQNKNTP